MGYSSCGASLNTTRNVFTEMLFQITSDYNSLPDPLAMDTDEIRWWYNGIRAGLIRATAKPDK